MAPVVTDTAAPVPHALLAPLRDHLPHSFSVLRRAQFSHLPQGTTPHARFLFASDPEEPFRRGEANGEGEGGSPRHFAAAYLDLSQYPETQMYLYSTLQDATGAEDDNGDDATADLRVLLPPAEVEHVLDLVGALLLRVRRIAEATVVACASSSSSSPPHALPPPGPRREGLMVGGLHEATYRLLRDRRGLASSYWNPHDAWFFRLEDLPALPPTAPSGGEGLRWDVVRREDVPLIASRTSIPKVEGTLMSEPSVAVRDARGELVAWGFMGTAGTLSTLHVEEPYRGRGIAKAVATKVMRNHNFADDGWFSADVHVDNVQSQGLCKSLGAKKGFRSCWTVITFESMPLPDIDGMARST